MKTAVIYARYSSDSQTEQSIEGQLRVCQEYAQKNNILILNTYIDRAMTGTNDNRPDFLRMIKDSSRKEWTYVIVYKLDRFSRNKYEMAMHKKTLKDNGTKVLSATEFIPDTPEGIIFESMLEGYAEYYSAELSQKIRRGNSESRRKGNLTGGKIPYGYKNVNKKAVIDEEEAEVVRYIYAQYANGVYVKDIISNMTEQGIFYNGKPFANNMVYHILSNERYSGVYRHNGEVFTNIYPVIVEQEIFNKVRSKVLKNKLGKNSVKVIYLLRQKVKCGYCGRSVNAETGTARDGTVKHYYKCDGRKKDRKCNAPIMRKEVLEKLVIDTVIEELKKPSNINKIVGGLLAIQEQQHRENQTLKNLSKEKKKVDTALQNLLKAIEQGIISNTTNKRLHELEEKQIELEQKMIIEKSKTAVKLTESEIRQFYEQALKNEARLLVEYLIKEVVLYADKIEIHYKSPLKNGPDESQGFSFSQKLKSFTSKTFQKKNTAEGEMLIESWIN